MLIVCPACDARYAVDDAQIGAGGRAVQCSACLAEWTVWSREPSEPRDAGRDAADAAPAASATSAPVSPARADAARGDARATALAAEAAPRDRILAATLEEPRPTRGGGFLAGFLLAVTAALCAALVYLRADDIAAAVPSLQPQIEAYAAWVDDLRATLAAALAAAR